jgi:hypothetical protein
VSAPYSVAQVAAFMAFAWVAGLLTGILAVVAWRLAHRVANRPLTINEMRRAHGIPPLENPAA